MKPSARYPARQQLSQVEPSKDPGGVLQHWIQVLAKLTYAMQPIVSPATGMVFGVEALLRGTDAVGYASPKELFDDAFDQQVLFFVDTHLREKAIARFKEITFHRKLLLFYNYDPRLLEMPDYRPGVTERLMANFDLEHDQICLEINEKYEVRSTSVLNAFVRNLKERGIRIALDDFGSGFAGFELFYHSEPNFLKFDRFLISGIDADSRKKSVCSHLIGLCKIQGITTIAEGLEREEELQACRELGFDLVQGFYVARPSTDIAVISPAYKKAKLASPQHAKLAENDAALLLRNISQLSTIRINDDVRTLLDKFQNQDVTNFFPVLDANDYPLGIIHERTLKQYIYSPFGKELLANRSVTRGLRSFVTRAPVADICTPQETMLEIFVSNPDSEGIIIVRDMKYAGFLNAKALLGIINEKKIQAARDINPLTGLSGNLLIHDFVGKSLADTALHSVFIYFDMDNFKPFNDKFGFRLGDRALSLFAGILRETATADWFTGHIGGDDFFLGGSFPSVVLADIDQMVKNILDRFADAVQPFFTPLERMQGYYASTARDNSIQEFPLLAASAAIIEVHAGEKPADATEISEILAQLKKKAKVSPGRQVAYSYHPNVPLVQENLRLPG